ncbi:thioredoxin domain-containing protein [Candidatus Woesearchaeota archaeon]|nr:thioredoxin domain-containing protein [Candidatus Woesearchaeota archaeon]
MNAKINWIEWGKESFEKAKKENKPILLDLTAVWCHWCHVMDATSYSDDEIAKKINGDFIPIKVYIDKRPDIRERYNMGGFPSTVFLDSDGHIIAGDTYVPAERFKLMLEFVKKSYKSTKNDIYKGGVEFGNASERGKDINKTKVSVQIIKDVLLSIEGNFDRFYGGFGMHPKFPAPEVLDLLFAQYKKIKNRIYLDMALKTLDCMYEGIYDKINFGFFRYSVTQDWKMPHYEKMIDTNAGLLRNYAVAFYITKDDRYRKIASEIIGYISRFLSNQKTGGFYGSQDADEEYYHLNHDERKKAKRPYVDKTIYVDWNAMMVSSYIKSGAVLDDSKATGFAIKTVDFILKNCYDKKHGLSHYFGGKPNVNGLLSDNIYFLNCLIDAYLVTQNQGYFKKIKEIAGLILKNFYDNKNGGFYDKVLKDVDFGALKRRDKRFLENSFCAIVFLRVYFLTKDGRYRESAEKTIAYFFDSYLRHAYFAASYAIAAEMLLDGGIKVDVVNKNEMIKICMASNSPGIIVNFIDKAGKKQYPGYETEGAYICKGTVCKGPITEQDKLEEELP